MKRYPEKLKILEITWLHDIIQWNSPTIADSVILCTNQLTIYSRWGSLNFLQVTYITPDGTQTTTTTATTASMRILIQEINDGRSWLHSYLHYLVQGIFRVCLTPVWSIGPFYANPKFGNNFGEFVRHRKGVTKLTSHTWRWMFTDSIILWITL